MAGTGVAYPADAVAGSPTYAALDGRNAYSALMGGATAAKPLGGFTGVRPGTPASTVVATTATTWTAQPFSGYIELEASGTNSGYLFAFGSVTSGAIAPAGGSARTDCIWVQIADSNTSDGSTGAPRVIIDYSQGTTTPPARAFVIAQINVPATGGGSPTVTWVAPYTAAAGGILPVPAGVYPASLYVGQYIDDPNVGLMRSDGTSWRPYGAAWVPIIPAIGVNAGGAAVLSSGGAVNVTNAASAIRLDGIFANFNRVKMHYRKSAASTTSTMSLQLTDATKTPVATGYDDNLLTSQANVATSVTSIAQTSMLISNLQTLVTGEVEFDGAGEAIATLMRCWYVDTPNPATSNLYSQSTISSLERGTVARDGVNILISTGSWTGKIWFEGLAIT